MAFLLEDSVHGRGIGTLLLEQLAATRPGERDPAAARRHTGRERGDAAGVRRLRVRAGPPAGQRCRRAGAGHGVPAVDAGADGRPRAGGRGPFVAPLFSPARGRGDRCRPHARRDRPRGAAQPRQGRLHRTRVRRESARRTGSRTCRRTRRSWTCPARSISRSSRSRPSRCGRCWPSAAAEGVAGAVVLTAGFSELGAAGRALQREILEIARRHSIRLIGPNCLGLVNTDPAVSLNATFAERGADAGRAGDRGAVRCGRHRGARPGRPHRARHLRVRLARQQGRCQRQRSAAALVGRPADRGDRAVPGVVREPAQVRRAGPAGRPDEADPGRQGRPLGRRPAGRRLAHRRGGDAGDRGRRAVRAVRRTADGHRRGTGGDGPGAGGPAAASWPPARRRRQRRRCRRARGRRGRAARPRPAGTERGRSA